MKFNPTWSQVALVAVLISAILLAYAFVAPAAGVVTGIVSTIFGSLFVNFQRPKADAGADDADNKETDK